MDDHGVLPRDAASFTAKVLREHFPLNGGCLGAPVASLNLQFFQDFSSPPGTRDNLMVGIFSVHVEGCGILLSHHVVECACSNHNFLRCLDINVEGSQQTGPTVGEDAKGILHNSSGTGQAVVEHQHLVGQLPPGIRLHHVGA